MNDVISLIRQELIDSGQATPMLLGYIDDRIKQCIDNFMINYLDEIELKKNRQDT